MATLSLRGKIPTTVKKRFKVMLYGAAGVGKTTSALMFPKPYFIDTEHGAENDQYVEALEKNGGVIFQTQDFDELLKEVRILATVKHDFQTLVIDPITTIYSSLVDMHASEYKGEAHGKHYMKANRKMKMLLDLLLRLDMNIVMTAHSKNEYGGDMEVLGQTFDGYKKLDYIFDVVLEVKERPDGSRYGIVKKSRISSFSKSSNFKFNYAEIESRYDKKLLEKTSVPIDLVTYESLDEIKLHLKTLKISAGQVESWMSKKGLVDISELNESCAKKFIEFLKGKYPKNTQASNETLGEVA